MSFKKVIKNTTYILLGLQLSRFINFFQVIMVVRYFSKSDYGIWSTVQAIPGMFVVLADMGINSIMLRRIAREKNELNEYFVKTLTMKFVLFIVFLAIIYQFAQIMHYKPELIRLIILSAISYVFMMFSELVCAVYRALEIFAFEAVLNITRSIGILSVAYLVIIYDLQLIGLIYGILIVNILIAINSILYYLKSNGINFKIYPFNTYVAFLKESLPFALLAFANPIFLAINVFLLSRMSTYESVAIYNVSYKIIIFLLVIPLALRKALFPTLSKLGNSNIEKYIETFNNACKIIALIGLPISIGVLLCADKIIYLLFSEKFIASVVPLQIMSVMLFFHYMRSIFNVTLYTRNMEYHVTALFIVATIINTILAVILIPKWDYVGACIAILISEIVIMGGGYYLISKRLFKIRYTITGIKLILSVSVMSVIVIFSRKLSLPVQIIIGAMGYCASIFIFKVFSTEEYRHLIELCKLKK